MKKLAVLLLALLICLVAAVPAYADQPVVQYDQDLVEDWAVGNCKDVGGPDVDVMDHMVRHVREIWYYDKGGFLDHAYFQNHGVDHLYLADRPAVEVSGPYNEICISTILTHPPETPYWSWNRNCTGANWNIEIPGYGTVFHEAGSRLVYVIEIPYQEIPMKQTGVSRLDLQLLCTALAQ